MKKLLAALMCALALPAWGAPAITNISTTNADGATVTITGTGFGTHPLRYSFLGGFEGVTDNDSLRNNMVHIDDLHAKGMQGWQTASDLSGDDCRSDSSYITRLRGAFGNYHVRDNRKSSITTKIVQGQPDCYTNGWGFYKQNKVPASGNRKTAWWSTDTLTTRSWYISWWEYEDILEWSTEFTNRSDKLFGPATGYPKDSNSIFEAYHARSGSFWAVIIWGEDPSSPAARVPGDVYPCAYPIDCDEDALCPDHAQSCENYRKCRDTVGSGCTTNQTCRYCSGCSAQVAGPGTCGNGDTSQGITYSPHGKWTRHEVYVVANRDSSEGATEEYEGVYQWNWQSPGQARVCQANYTGEYGIVTHAWEWRDEALNGNSCPSRTAPMATWNKFTNWRFTNYAQGTADVRESLDDIYLQADTQARVVLGNSNTLANSTHIEIIEPTAWSSTSITAKLNHGALSGTKYLFVVDGNGAASGGAALTPSNCCAKGWTCCEEISE